MRYLKNLLFFLITIIWNICLFPFTLILLFASIILWWTLKRDSFYNVLYYMVFLYLTIISVPFILFEQIPTQVKNKKIPEPESVEDYIMVYEIIRMQWLKDTIFYPRRTKNNKNTK